MGLEVQSLHLLVRSPSNKVESESNPNHQVNEIRDLLWISLFTSLSVT